MIKEEYQPVFNHEEEVPVEYANLDRKLTRRQRNFIWLAVNNPRMTYVECAAKAGYKDPRQQTIQRKLKTVQPKQTEQLLKKRMLDAQAAYNKFMSEQ